MSRLDDFAPSEMILAARKDVTARERDLPQGLIYGLIIGGLFFGLGTFMAEAILTGCCLGALVGLAPAMRHNHCDQPLSESPLHVGLLLGGITAVFTGVLARSLNVGFMFFVIGVISGLLGLMTSVKRRSL